MDLVDNTRKIMKLDKKCISCNVELTTLTARKRRDVVSGFRNQCKSCHNAAGRKNTKKKKCEQCGVLGIMKGKRSFCSLLCRFKNYCTPTHQGCWEWRGRWRDGDGYGLFVIGKKRYRAHRISYELFKNKIGDGLLVCHSCDNPPCVNPNHLWLGTVADNVRDYINKKLLSKEK